MAYETRSEYHRQLDQIRAGVGLQLALTDDALVAARAAFFSGDAAAIPLASKRTAEIVEIRESLETLVVTQLARQAPTGSDLRHLVSVLEILSEVGLTAALVWEIARRGGMGLGLHLTAPLGETSLALFERIRELWRAVAQGYDAYEPSEEGLLVTVEAEWQACDGLRARLVAELRAGTLAAPALVEMALVVRFLQRIGDHAVGTARGIDAAGSR
ncbi:MAG: hypothetical protein ACRDZ8_11655 [Acidimicrobiales bacterium]